jgi:hypothetical protein
MCNEIGFGCFLIFGKPEAEIQRCQEKAGDDNVINDMDG